MDAWGLNTDAMGYDQWDYVHITTWNFFPFLLRRVGAVPRWVVDVTFVVWVCGLASLIAVSAKLISDVRKLPASFEDRAT
jgi:hypothetical protein